MTAPARIQSAGQVKHTEHSEVVPDDFCRECFWHGCEYCEGRGHRVASRPDVSGPREFAPAWLRLGRGQE